MLEVQNINTFDKEHKIIKAYYNENDVINLEKKIENNNNWILSTQIKSNLTIFIPSSFISNDNIYYSIYNKTLDEYNTIPN